jgi:hypothetical protein
MSSSQKGQKEAVIVLSEINDYIFKMAAASKAEFFNASMSFSKILISL